MPRTLRAVCPACDRNVAGLVVKGELRAGWHRHGHAQCPGGYALAKPYAGRRRTYYKPPAPARSAGLPSALRGAP